jgi:outer membrane receptor for ferrienterochelin and colicins
MKIKEMKKVLFCLLMIGCLPVFAQYDAHLTGHVLDENTGEHLPYVNVQVKGTDIGTVTDETGHYFLRDLPIGKQTIVFRPLSYGCLPQKR